MRSNSQTPAVKSQNVKTSHPLFFRQYRSPDSAGSRPGGVRTLLAGMAAVCGVALCSPAPALSSPAHRLLAQQSGTSDATTFNQRGIARYKQGDFQGAIQDFT